MGHVTLQPKQAPAGGYARMDVRVPNEEEDAATDKVRVQFPPGFASVRYEPSPGWKVDVRMERLDRPVEVEGEKVTERVSEVVFTAAKGEGIGPGQFRDFGLSMKLPDQPGQTLSFKALQSYDNGETVRWIGSPDADKPAAQVELVADDSGHGREPASTSREVSADRAVAGGGGGDDGGPSTALVVAALALGALGALAGTAGVLTARKMRTA